MVKRKLKTLAQLLAEYPDYSLKLNGELVLLPDLSIYPENLRFLGQEDEWWLCDPRLLEPLPKPVRLGKLYAYENSTIQINSHQTTSVVTPQIIHTDDTTFIPSECLRPGYDIDFDEIDGLKARVLSLESIVQTTVELLDYTRREKAALESELYATDDLATLLTARVYDLEDLVDAKFAKLEERLK